MMVLEGQYPDVASELHNDNVSIHKSRRYISVLVFDQAQEPNNAVIDGDGGAIGLTEYSAALRGWMLAGPEMSRLLAAYVR